MSQANDYSNPRCVHARRGLIIRPSDVICSSIVTISYCFFKIKCPGKI